MAISIQEYIFHCRWTTEARLPAYLGSALRGAFGWALKKSSCSLRRQECATCILRGQCAYAWIFETERYIDAAGHNINARPHPYMFRPEKGASGTRHP
ncbi:MAG: hypothetical protein JZU65_20455, partial [Chlorobium sp.]|nr:hypothetical protein [Chlorobium sp.]